MIDGLKNSIVETDVVPLPDAEIGSKENFASNALITQSKTLETAREGARDYDLQKGRRWKSSTLRGSTTPVARILVTPSV